jgi:hypothetical protein
LPPNSVDLQGKRDSGSPGKDKKTGPMTGAIELSFVFSNDFIALPAVFDGQCAILSMTVRQCKDETKLRGECNEFMSPGLFEYFDY